MVRENERGGTKRGGATNGWALPVVVVVVGLPQLVWPSKSSSLRKNKVIASY